MNPQERHSISGESRPGPACGADAAGRRSRVSVVVCTRDRHALLEQCLGHLAGQTYPDFEVMVVDNAPARAVRDICERWAATWVPAPVPGLTIARNVGARMARGEIIAYIDDDAVAEPGWLAALVTDFSDPGVAAVAGRARYVQALGESRRLSDVESPEAHERPKAVFDLDTPDWFALASFGGIGDGCNMAFRRELIASTVPFDERLGRGRLLDCADEHVVFASLIGRGHRVAHNPQAVVRHPCAASLASREEQRLNAFRASIAHILFLWGAFPANRADILRFLGRAVAKRLRPSNRRAAARVALLRVSAVRAIFEGVGLFLRARREWRRGTTGAGEGVSARSRVMAQPGVRAR